MFVTIENGVEGLISFREMDGYYEFNESNMSASNTA